MENTFHRYTLLFLRLAACLLLLVLASACSSSQAGSRVKVKDRSGKLAPNRTNTQAEAYSTTHTTRKATVASHTRVQNPTPKGIDHPKAEAFTDTKATPKAREVVAAAKAYLNTPYRLGGTNRAGMDCSGLMLTAFKQIGVALPRTANEQALIGKAVKRPEIAVGDMLFFSASIPGHVGHAGLVVAVSADDVEFIHASTSQGVRIDALSTGYYRQHYMWARRVL